MLCLFLTFSEVSIKSVIQYIHRYIMEKWNPMTLIYKYKQILKNDKKSHGIFFQLIGQAFRCRYVSVSNISF